MTLHGCWTENWNRACLTAELADALPAELRRTLTELRAPFWANLHPLSNAAPPEQRRTLVSYAESSEQRGTLQSYAAPNWAPPQPTELRRTLWATPNPNKLRRTLTELFGTLWATTRPTKPRRSLLSYAALYWVTSPPIELWRRNFEYDFCIKVQHNIFITKSAFTEKNWFNVTGLQNCFLLPFLINLLA